MGGAGRAGPPIPQVRLISNEHNDKLGASIEIAARSQGREREPKSRHSIMHRETQTRGIPSRFQSRLTIGFSGGAMQAGDWCGHYASLAFLPLAGRFNSYNRKELCPQIRIDRLIAC